MDRAWQLIHRETISIQDWMNIVPRGRLSCQPISADRAGQREVRETIHIQILCSISRLVHSKVDDDDADDEVIFLADAITTRQHSFSSTRLDTL